MSVETLAARLVQDLKPVRRRNVAFDAAILAAVCLLELALFVGLGFVRPDLGAAMGAPPFWWKLASLALIASIGASVALFSFDPTRSPRRGLRWLAAVAALCLAAGWVIDADWQGLPTLAARLDWYDGLQCVTKIIVLSIPAAVGLGALMRRGAPTDTGGTALSVGIAAAAWGAFVFVFACPYDDPLYIVIWYAAGCAIVTLVTRLILPPLTRW